VCDQYQTGHCEHSLERGRFANGSAFYFPGDKYTGIKNVIAIHLWATIEDSNTDHVPGINNNDFAEF
jgi:hypothetical protein